MAAEYVSGYMKNRPCYFLQLPAELRNRIYELILIQDEEIDAATWCRLPHSPRCLPGGSIPSFRSLIIHGFEPALLSTCKQVRKEGLPIFYGQNTFFGGPGESTIWLNWLQKLSPLKRGLVKNIKLRFRVIWGRPGDDGPTSERGRVTPVLEEYLEEARRSLRAKGIVIPDTTLVIMLCTRRYWTNLFDVEEWRVDGQGVWTGVPVSSSLQRPGVR
jgi:hypothetical protein